jgi:hypothetical protein
MRGWKNPLISPPWLKKPYFLHNVSEQKGIKVHTFGAFFSQLLCIILESLFAEAAELNIRLPNFKYRRHLLRYFLTNAVSTSMMNSKNLRRLMTQSFLTLD